MRTSSWHAGNRVRVGFMGFTMIELLVVIAVITILASLLLPSLGGARQSVRRISCASNMRSICQGVFMYANDYGGYMPMSTYNAQHIYYLCDYLKLSLNGCVKADNIKVVQFGSPKGIAFCPSLSDPPQSSPCASSTLKNGSASYYYSCYMPTGLSANFSNYFDERSGCWLNSTAYSTCRRLDTIKSGSVMLADMNWHTVSGVVYQCAIPQPGLATSYPNYDANGYIAPGWKHAGSSNFSFLDGHVSFYKYSGTQLFDNNYIPLK